MSATHMEDAAQIIRRSLERELGLLEMKKRLVEEEIRKLEQRYEMDSREFLEKFERGELGDSQDCFEWWGLIRGQGAIDGDIKKVKVVLAS